jgi:hypothetical protein
VRRCLHTFLIVLLTLALSMDAARACWFLRVRRQCRPVAVSRPCPPPTWSAGGTVVVHEWAASDGCHQPVACEAALACCEESVVASHAPALAGAVSTDLDAESLTQSVVRDQPTEASDGQGASAPADPQPEPPAPRDAELVQPASNNEPLPDLAPVEPPATAVLPVDEPVAPPLDLEPDIQDTDPVDEEMQDGTDAEGLLVPPATDAPTDEAAEMADDAEPPLEEEAAEPAPAVEPEPEQEPNLFEEFEDGDAAGDDSDEAMAPEDEEASPSAAADEPLLPDAPVDDADEPAVAEGDPLMADDEDAAAAEPAARIDSDDEPLPAPADDSDPFAAADDSEALAAAEPVRRWIHASGAHSLVGRLVDVTGDGHCLLEAAGRRIRVPLQNLSGHDRDYIRQAGVRVAALREARERAAAAAATNPPQATETAAL